MAKRGPKPRPDELKRAEGEKVPARGWRPNSEAPAEPDWQSIYPGRTGDAKLNAQNVRLRASCREEWRRVTGGLEAIGLLTQLDYALLIQHVTAVALYFEAQHAIARYGLVVKGDRGQWSKNPAVTVANNQVTVLKQTMPPLGLSPSARNFLVPPNPDELPPEAVDEDEDMLPGNVVNLWS